MKNKIFYLLFFSVILALSRIIPHPPNFTPILACAIMAPLMAKDRLYGAAIPVVAMFLSDIILGFHPYQLVIYSTILIISLVTPRKKNYIMLGGMTIGSSVWFFLTTNFAVWIIWDYYPKTIAGLLECYTLAIPFFKNTLLSTIFFTAIITISINYLDKINNKFNNFILSNKFFKTK